MPFEGSLEEKLGEQATQARLVGLSEEIRVKFPELASGDPAVVREADDWLRDQLKRVAELQGGAFPPRTPDTTFENTLRERLLLDALSRKGRPRKHRLKVRPNAELAAVLAPVGKTIFDEWVENSVEKSTVNNEEGRRTAPDDLKDDKLRAAAEAKAVGAMFANARGEVGLREAARAAGISHANLGKIEKGQTDPSLKTIKKIADGIDHDVEIRLIPRGNS